MREYIKKMQSKSEIERKQILFISVSICMAIVVFIWVSTLGSHFAKKEVLNDEIKKEEGAKPFALFGETIKDTYNKITASVGNISSTVKKEKEASVGGGKVIDLIPVEYSNQ